MNGIREYIDMPLCVQDVGSGVLTRSRASVDKNIEDMLDLIVFTPKGSFSADPDFGFEYWNHEFSNVDVRRFNDSYLEGSHDASSVDGISRKQCERSLVESIIAYEPRLQSPGVKIELDVNGSPRRRKVQPKYEMRIIISGSIDDGLGICRPYEKKISFMVEPVIRNSSGRIGI